MRLRGPVPDHIRKLLAAGAPATCLVWPRKTTFEEVLSWVANWFDAEGGVGATTKHGTLAITCAISNNNVGGLREIAHIISM